MAKILDACADHYDVKEEGVFLIVRDLLTIQMPVGWGLPKFRLRPESSRDFFVAELSIRVRFQTDTNGQDLSTARATRTSRAQNKFA